MRKCMENSNISQSKGIKSHIDGQPVLIGNYVLMQDEQIHISSEQNALIEEYKSHYNLLFLAYQNELIECSAFILL